jgi:hypothetical protein
VTIRFGRRSTGGAVKRGHGGYYLTPHPLWPGLHYIDPETGDTWVVSGWRAAWRRFREEAGR